MGTHSYLIFIILVFSCPPTFRIKRIGDDFNQLGLDDPGEIIGNPTLGD